MWYAGKLAYIRVGKLFALRVLSDKGWGVGVWGCCWFVIYVYCVSWVYGLLITLYICYLVDGFCEFVLVCGLAQGF